MNEFKAPEPEVPIVSLPSPKTRPETSWAGKWKESSKRWARETNLAYLSNPTSRKDFHVQFRGSRSVWLFAAYVLFLGVAAVFQYWNIASGSQGAIGDQNRLDEFYQLVVTVLGVAISLVAPAMAATAVVSEKQQRSLDLVFTSPIRPRVYLLGKIVSVFRYTWILLALSLPFTAMSVVLGGATWIDVVATYAMLSLHGVVFTSIGLFYSSISERATAAVLYTFGSVVGYLAITACLADLTSLFGPSFVWLLNPFGLNQGLTHFTQILGLPIPNIALAAATCLLLTKLLLAGAGAALVKPKPVERAALRLEIVALYSTLVGVVFYLAAPNLMPLSNSFGFAAALSTFPLVLFMPFLSAYGFDAESNYKPNGLVSWAKTLTGSPSGSITYIWLFAASCFLGAFAAGLGYLGSALNGMDLAIYLAYTLGFWSFFWAVGRAWSSFLVGVKTARVLQALSFIVIVGAPVPLIAYVAKGQGPNFWNSDILINKFWILQPVFSSTGLSAVIPWTIFFLIATPLIARWSEKNLRARLANKGATLGQIERAAGNFEAP